MLGMEATCRHLEQPGKTGGPTVVLLAEDLAPRSSSRIERLAAQRPEVKIVRALSQTRMGRALGRDAVGVVAIAHRVLGRRLLLESERRAALQCSPVDSVVHAAEETRKND